MIPDLGHQSFAESPVLLRYGVHNIQTLMAWYGVYGQRCVVVVVVVLVVVLDVCAVKGALLI